MVRKAKPLHQLAREKGLPLSDQRELQRFRTFLRVAKSKGRPAAYEAVYGKKLEA